MGKPGNTHRESRSDQEGLREAGGGLDSAGVVPAEIALRPPNRYAALIFSEPGTRSFVATLEAPKLQASTTVRTSTRDLIAAFRRFAAAEEAVPDAQGFLRPLLRWYSNDQILDLRATPYEGRVTLHVTLDGRFSGWSAQTFIDVDAERFRAFSEEVAHFFPNSSE